jgi:hypothetical protein
MQKKKFLNNLLKREKIFYKSKGDLNTCQSPQRVNFIYKSNSIEQGEILRGIPVLFAGLIFRERNIRLPVPLIFNASTGTDSFTGDFGGGLGTGNVIPGFFFFFSGMRCVYH